MRYHHVDVFTGRPYSGNSLAVFPDADALTGGQMQAITRELRHFESVFLVRDGVSERRRRARVFDLAEELDFAGHPLIGAAAVLHALHGGADHETWTLRLPARAVEVITERRGPGRYESLLDQGAAAFLGRPDPHGLAALFALDPGDLDPALPRRSSPRVCATWCSPYAATRWAAPASRRRSTCPWPVSAPSSPTCWTPRPWRDGTGTTTGSSKTSPPAAARAAPRPICAATAASAPVSGASCAKAASPGVPAR
ncbi:PhzF family phenazine biosynthesis isomerase [Streptomyces sp. MS1.HAVA.3]|uniref:PhzF family phenazine biosynthesis isomerase n=1 Tax=Streptomyces caledonius TaxID=3134107 RepID=A0ABU8TXK5_9ACTN